MRKSLQADSEAFKRLIKSFKGNQDSRLLATVLRFHLLAEYYIDLIILAYLKRGRVLVDKHIAFSQKIDLVDSFGIVPEEIIVSIKELNALRNKSAHDVDYQISERDIDRIGRPFGKGYTEFARRYLGRDKENDPDKAYFEAFLYNTLTLLFSEINYLLEKIEGK